MLLAGEMKRFLNNKVSILVMSNSPYDSYHIPGIMLPIHLLYRRNEIIEVIQLHFLLLYGLYLHLQQELKQLCHYNN